MYIGLKISEISRVVVGVDRDFEVDCRATIKVERRTEKTDIAGLSGGDVRDSGRN